MTMLTLINVLILGVTNILLVRTTIQLSKRIARLEEK